MRKITSLIFPFYFIYCSNEQEQILIIKKPVIYWEDIDVHSNLDVFDKAVDNQNLSLGS
jgi:hypothetical protein